MIVEFARVFQLIELLLSEKRKGDWICCSQSGVLTFFLNFIAVEGWIPFPWRSKIFWYQQLKWVHSDILSLLALITCMDDKMVIIKLKVVEVGWITYFFRNYPSYPPCWCLFSLFKCINLEPWWWPEL